MFDPLKSDFFVFYCTCWSTVIGWAAISGTPSWSSFPAGGVELLYPPRPVVLLVLEEAGKF